MRKVVTMPEPEKDIKGEARQRAVALEAMAERDATVLLDDTSAGTMLVDDVAKLKAQEMRGTALLKASEILAVASLRAEQLEAEKTKAEGQRDVILEGFQGQLIPLLTETAIAMKGVQRVLVELLTGTTGERATLDGRAAIFRRIEAKLDRLLGDHED